MGLPQTTNLRVIKTMANPVRKAESGSGTEESVKPSGCGHGCGEAMPRGANVASSVQEPRNASGKVVPNQELLLEATPVTYPRHLYTTPTIRHLVAETQWWPHQLVMPMFVRDGITAPVEIPSMPGQYQHMPESLAELGRHAVDAGISDTTVFGVPHGGNKDFAGSPTWDPAGIQSRGLEALVKVVGGDLVIMANNCLDETTTHGYCGLLRQDDTVDDDWTVPCYAATAVSQARAGAWVVALSGMMNGQVGVIRTALDEVGFTDVATVAYPARYASGLLGPFRDTVGCLLQGDRHVYQRDPANRREGWRGVLLDLDEGANIVMVKSVSFYLDVLVDAAAGSPALVAAYQVSGEYSIIEVAAAHGWIDRARVIDESLTPVVRTGADVVPTCYALKVAEGLV